MLIRGTVIELEIPLIFNARLPLDPFDYCDVLTDEMRSTLTENEHSSIVDRFSTFYKQASSILNIIARMDGSPPRLASKLLEAAWSDLRAIAGTYRPRDPAAMLFLAHQAVEKSLKSRISEHEPYLTDDQIRRMYGHDLKKLATACIMIDPRLGGLDTACASYDFGQEVRYIRPQKTIDQSLDLVDTAHAICGGIASSFRRMMGKKNANS